MKETNKLHIKINIEKNIFQLESNDEVSIMEMINVMSLIMSEYNMVLMTNDDMEAVDFLMGDKNAILDRIVALGTVEMGIIEYEVNTFGRGSHYIYEIEEIEDIEMLDAACILSVVISYLGDLMMDELAADDMMKKLSEEDGVKEITNLRKTIDLSVTIMQMYGMLGHTYKDKRVNDLFYLDRVANKLAVTSEIIKETLESIEEIDEEDEDYMSDMDKERYDMAKSLGNNVTLKKKTIVYN